MLDQAGIASWPMSSQEQRLSWVLGDRWLESEAGSSAGAVWPGRPQLPLLPPGGGVAALGPSLWGLVRRPGEGELKMPRSPDAEAGAGGAADPPECDCGGTGGGRK